jgi:hypothetical protein
MAPGTQKLACENRDGMQEAYKLHALRLFAFPLAKVSAISRSSDRSEIYPTMSEEPMAGVFIDICVSFYGDPANIGHFTVQGFDLSFVQSIAPLFRMDLGLI